MGSGETLIRHYRDLLNVLLKATLDGIMLWLAFGEFSFVMPTGRKGERSGGRSRIGNVLLKVKIDYTLGHEKMFSAVWWGKSDGGSLRPRAVLESWMVRALFKTNQAEVGEMMCLKLNYM